MYKIGSSRGIDELGLVVVPPEVRAILGLGPGDRIVLCADEGRVYIEKMERPQNV